MLFGLPERMPSKSCVDEVIELLMLRAQEILRICCAPLVWDNSGGLLPCCVLAVCVTHATIEVYLFLANIVSE